MNYQVEKLKALSDQNNYEIVGITKKASIGKWLNSFEMNSLLTIIWRKDIDCILIYSPSRISIYLDIFDEFEMFCHAHDVSVISLKDYLNTEYIYSWIKFQCVVTHHSHHKKLVNGGNHISYDYKKEYNHWKKWKNAEEKVLRKHHVSEHKIAELHQFDLDQFNAERRFKRNHNVTKDIFFIIQPVYDKKETLTIEDILDSIENEALFEYLKYVDPISLRIIELKVMGYNMEEISQKLGISLSTIYQKIKKVKKFRDMWEKNTFSWHI